MFVKIKTPLYLTILSLLQEKVTMYITFRVMQELSFLTSLLYLASSLGPRLALDMKKLISVSSEGEDRIQIQRCAAAACVSWTGVAEPRPEIRAPGTSRTHPGYRTFHNPGECPY